MAFETARNSELILICGPAAWANVPGITELGYTHESDVARRGQGAFGAHGPRGITEVYNGISGTFSYDDPEGETVVDAVSTCQDPASYITGDLSNRYPIYLVANAYDNDHATPIRGHFVEYAMIASAPKAVAGTSALQRSFQAKFARDFAGKKVAVQVLPGNATPVTALALTDDAYEYEEDKFALLVLRQSTASRSVKVLKQGTDYTETASTITLTTGLAATEQALVVYVVD